MDTTNPLNLTRNAKLLLAVAGLLLWGIGGTLDGASLRSLVSVPVFVAVWMGLIWAIDRWVRPGARSSALTPRGWRRIHPLFIRRHIHPAGIVTARHAAHVP
jgi:hypothetical protein